MPNDVAQTVFHQRIRANTDAMTTLAATAAAIARDVGPRLAQVEGDLPRITQRVLALETLPHEIKEQGRAIHRRIDDDTRLLREWIDIRATETERRIEILAIMVKALQDWMAPPTWRHGMLYAIATNSDGSFDRRTTLGRLFLEHPVGRKALNGISDIAALPRPKRTQFIETMGDAYRQLRPDQQEHIGPLSDGDWGRLFDCAPELAHAFAAAHPPSPALAI